jgi:hypothetical protein
MGAQLYRFDDRHRFDTRGTTSSSIGFSPCRWTRRPTSGYHSTHHEPASRSRALRGDCPVLCVPLRLHAGPSGLHRRTFLQPRGGRRGPFHVRPLGGHAAHASGRRNGRDGSQQAVLGGRHGHGRNRRRNHGAGKVPRHAGLWPRPHRRIGRRLGAHDGRLCGTVPVRTNDLRHIPSVPGLRPRPG